MRNKRRIFFENSHPRASLYGKVTNHDGQVTIISQQVHITVRVEVNFQKILQSTPTSLPPWSTSATLTYATRGPNSTIG